MILALDYGDKKIGTAISDPLNIIAKPLDIIINNGWKNVSKEIIILVKNYNVSKVVVGLPITLKNQVSKQTQEVYNFIEYLSPNLPVPIIAYDERLTSLVAKQSLILQGVKTGYNKKEIDKTAAAIFLQNYLDESK